MSIIKNVNESIYFIALHQLCFAVQIRLSCYGGNEPSYWLKLLFTIHHICTCVSKLLVNETTNTITTIVYHCSKTV